MVAAGAAHPGPAGARRLQEQLGRQGQLLRLPRELPDGPGRPVRPGRSRAWCRTSSPARSSPGRARSGRRRRRSTRRTVDVPALPAGRVLRGEGRARDDAEAPHRQHPGRAPRRPQALPAPARHRGRRQPVRGRHLPEGGHHRHRAGHDRGRRRPAAATWPWPTRCGPCTRCRPTSPWPRRSRWPTARRPPRSSMQWELFGAARKYAEERGLDVPGRRRRGRRSWCCEHWEAVLHGLETDPASLSPTRSTGWPSCSCSRPTGTATGAAGTTTGWPRWTCSTTTCARTGRCSRAWTCERLVDAAEVVDGRHRAAPGHPGLVPGQVPGPVARRRGHRQLGFPGLRHRHRPAAARPYDGSPEGNGRTRRTQLLAAEHGSGRPAGPI